MPLYVYEIIQPDGSPGEQFEVLQSMSEAAFTVHPDSGEPVRRVFGTPNAPRAWTDSQGKAKISDSNLASKGFTKYVKSGDGSYEKAAGTGPKKLKRQ
jgi:hypothetical protein